MILISTSVNHNHLEAHLSVIEVYLYELIKHFQAQTAKDVSCLLDIGTSSSLVELSKGPGPAYGQKYLTPGHMKTFYYLCCSLLPLFLGTFKRFNAK